MSDAASIASATGVPEELVLRSAQARAAASGTSVDEVLGAWGGGGSIATVATAPAASAASAPTPEPTEAPTESESSGPATAIPAAVPAPTVVMVAAKSDPDAAPLLVGRTDHPIMTLAVLIAIFAIGALLSVGVPGLDARNAAADQIPGTTPILSDQALAGRAIYVQEGCMYCHTQQVRSVVTDVGLGPVTEPGTSPAAGPQTLGFVRIGPDLTHIGTRHADSETLEGALVDPKSTNPDSLMPSYAHLSTVDMKALVQYLEESK